MENNTMLQTEGLNKDIRIQSSDNKQEKNKQSNHLTFSFFLFVNPTSGGNQASELTNLNAELIRFQLYPNEEIQGAHIRNNTQIDLYIYNLKDNESRKKGFENLRNIQQSKQTQVRVVAGGGDGTVMWVVEEMIKQGIDFEQCPIGIIAYGTGNDFSRVTGWGGGDPGQLTTNGFRGLKKLIHRWLSSLTEDFDIWDIKITTYEQGCFKKIQKNANNMIVKIPLKDEKNESQNLTVMRKKMSNYFSIGVESRIGLGFDRKRTTSAFLNKVVYCWEGFKKMFMKTKKIPTVIDILQKVDLDAQELKQSQQQQQGVRKLEEVNISVDHETFKKQTLLQSKPTTEAVENQQQTLTWKEEPASFVVLNINSMMGGVMNIWESAKNNNGLKQADKANKSKSPEIFSKFDKSSFGDGKIEILSFESISQIGREKFIKGQAKRIEQGSGPYVIKFNETDEQGQTIITYFQVDGEYYQVISPKSVTIQPTKSIPRSKIKVMVDNQSRVTNLKN